MKKKGLSFLLAAAMLLTMNGIPTLAGSVAGGNEAERIEETREIPVNPVHNCTQKDDDTDTTTWSYVYFGSYPQAEVTGDELTAAITGAGYDANGDAWVDGMKYRRISRHDTNYDGYYENDDPFFGDSEYRYFKWKRIKWRVLNVDGSTMFVMSDKGLDCKCFNEVHADITWETCTLRNWLNRNFYGTAFDRSEQEAIVSQTVVNEDNTYLGRNTKGGNNTTDKVFLLSISEVLNPDYGFCENYLTHSVSRGVEPSEYAHVRGASVSPGLEFISNCFWWLRSPGGYQYYAAGVRYDGHVNQIGYAGNELFETVVPALRINLSSDLWYAADDGTSGSGGSGEIIEEDQNSEENKNSNVNSNEDTTQAKPKETTLTGKIKAAKKAMTVQWQKQVGVSGYQIQYSTNKKFKKNATKSKTVKKPAATKVTIKKLKSGKKYFVRIRTYKTVNGTSYYSEWSKAKTVKIKK